MNKLVKGSMVRCGLDARMAVALMMTFLAAGCTPTLEPSGPRAPTIAIDSSAPSGLSLTWRNTELRPVGQPIAIGEVIIGIVAEDHMAHVVAIDPRTGRILWRDVMTHSAIPRGAPISVLQVGDSKVAYLRMTDKDSNLGDLVVADARTGKELARAPTGRFPSAPIMCENGRDVCAITTLRFQPKRQYRLDLSSGEYVLENTLLLRGSRFIDDTGLLDVGDRPGNTLGLLRAGKVYWLTKVSDAFPSGSSTDDGWHWNLFRGHVFVGTVGSDSRTTQGKYRVFDYDSVAMAGLSERNGEVLWRDRGSHFGCHLNTRDYPVRCRTHGKGWFHTERSTFHLADLDVTIEGFDPETGKTTWSLPMGPAEELEDAVKFPAIAGPAKILVNGRNGPVVVDYAVGTLRAPERGATFWCMEQATYEMAPPYRLGTAQWSYTRDGGTFAWICDEARRPTTRLPSIAATMAAGASVGKFAVIATRDGYLGFRAP